ncbi:hypothetical protein BGZ67_000660, partial [Mortierella alpina]
MRYEELNLKALAQKMHPMRQTDQKDARKKPQESGSEQNTKRPPATSKDHSTRTDDNQRTKGRK